MLSQVSGVPGSLNEALNIKLHSGAPGPVEMAEVHFSISHGAAVSFSQFSQQQQQKVTDLLQLRKPELPG